VTQFVHPTRYEEARAESERALEIDPESASATASSNIAATSALLGDLPRRAALAETLQVWPNMSLATLRALFAAMPKGPVEEFFRALRLAGWTPPDDDDTVTSATGSTPANEAGSPSAASERKIVQ
jgi:hypothetical protein